MASAYEVLEKTRGLRAKIAMMNPRVAELISRNHQRLNYSNKIAIMNPRVAELVSRNHQAFPLSHFALAYHEKLNRGYGGSTIAEISTDFSSKVTNEIRAIDLAFETTPESSKKDIKKYIDHVEKAVSDGASDAFIKQMQQKNKQIENLKKWNIELIEDLAKLTQVLASKARRLKVKTSKPIKGREFKQKVFEIYKSALEGGQELQIGSILYRLDDDPLVRKVDRERREIEWGAGMENPVSFDRLRDIITDVRNHLKDYP